MPIRPKECLLSHAFFLHNLNFFPLSITKLHFISAQNCQSPFLISKIYLSCNARAHSIPNVSNAYLKIAEYYLGCRTFKHSWESKESIFTALLGDQKGSLYQSRLDNLWKNQEDSVK